MATHEQSPNQRLATWDALGTEINRSSKALYGQGLEPAVNDAVVGLNAILGGYYTRMSCEGHDEGVMGNVYPWIGFDVSTDEAVAHSQLRRLQGLLDDFYQDREGDPRLRLGIYPDFGGQRSGQFTLVTVIGHERETHNKTVSGLSAEDIADLLDAQQQEMTDFAGFLKQRFTGGFQIEPFGNA